MNTNTKYGRTSVPQQSAPPTDPRTRNHSPPRTSGDSPGGICRDFIWGICSLGTQCMYRHELEFEAMKAVLKFCHDHQNRTGCTRPDCTYLHTSREEQNLFLTTGQIPRVLIDRYKGVSSTSAPAPPVSESVPSAPPRPHHMMYEHISQPPPPPPPPPTSASAGAPDQHSTMMRSSVQGPMLGPISGPMQGPIPGPMQGPIPGPMQGPIPGPMQGPIPGPMQGPIPGPMQGPIPGPMQGPIPGSMQGPILGPMVGPMHGPMPMPAPMPPIPAPMPPPPPPPPPPTSSVSSARMAGPMYTSPLPIQSTHQNITSIYHPPLLQTALPPMFDPTRPPPPIPQATPRRILKRAIDECEAGPSKVRKVEHTNDGCECCVQRLIRIDQLTQQLEQLEQEVEQARNSLAHDMDKYEKKKQMLRSIVHPDVYRGVEDYVENGSTSPLSQRNEFYSPNLFGSQISAPLNTNHDLQLERLLDRLVGGGSTRGLIDMPSGSASDDLGLLAMTMRARPNSADCMNTLLELLRSERERARAPAPVAAGEAELGRPSAAGNGFSRYLGGGGASPFARPLYDAGASTSLLTAGSARPFREAGAPATLQPYGEGAAGGAAPLPYGEGPPRYPPPPRPFPPPPAEPPAPPAAQPPPAARPMFSHFAPNNMPNPPYPGAALNQPPRPPMPPPNNPYFMGGRYPNQHYYPPYQ